MKTAPIKTPPIVSNINSKVEAKPNWNANLYIIKIKRGNDYTIEPAIAFEAKLLSNSKNKSIVAINTEFFDSTNQKITSQSF